MEDKILINSKTLILKIRTDTTEKEIIDFFNVNQYCNELTISIKFHPYQSILLQLVSELLNTVQEISSLSLKINQFFDLNLDNFLTQLKKLKSLKSFTFKLNSDVEFNEESKISFGESLRHLENLENLTFYINSAKIPLYSNILDLKEGFQKLNKLTKISITIPQIQNQSYFVNKLFGGMSIQLQLQELFFSISKRFDTDENYFTFCQELKGLINLKKLSISFLFYQGVSKKNQKMLQKALLSLTKLETLNLRLQIKNFKKAFVIKGLKNLTNLKHLLFDTFSNTDSETISKYLSEISQCTQLESTQLELSLQYNPITKQELQETIELIYLIPNLKSLKLNFSYSYKLNLISLVNFIANLYCQVLLQKLEIQFITTRSYEYCDNDSNSEEQILQCKKVIGQLKEFKINMFENLQNNWPVNNFFDLMNVNSKLEKIDLRFSSSKQYQHSLENVKLTDIISNNTQLEEFRLYLGTKYMIQQDELERFFQNLKVQNRIKKFKFSIEGNDGIFQISNTIISDSIRSLSNLQDLEFTLNEYSFVDFQNIQHYFQSIKSLSMLKILKLKLSIKDQLDIVFEEISNAFSNMQQLKQIDLEIISKSNQQLPNIINLINLPPKLNYLKLKIVKDNINFSNLQKLFESLINSKNLKFLYLDINMKLEIQDIINLQSILSHLKRLATIMFSNHQFTLVQLLNLFKQLPVLEKLDLGGFKTNYNNFYFYITRKVQNKWIVENSSKSIDNKDSMSNQMINDDLLISVRYSKEITQEDIMVLSQALTNNQIKIFQIDIMSYNEVGVNFIQSLQKLTHLVEFVIDIQDNSQIRTEILIELVNTLKYFKHLRIFQIIIEPQNQEIDWRVAKHMFKGLKSIQTIEKLTIMLKQNFNIEENILERILPNINYLSSIKELTLEIHFQLHLQKLGSIIQENLQKLNALSSLSLDFPFLKNNSLELQKEFYQSISQIKSIRNISVNKIKKYTNILYKMKRLVNLCYYD